MNDKTKPHEIKIELKELPRKVPPGTVRAAVPAIPGGMRVGDTVFYSCTDGSFRVEFDDGSPLGLPSGPAAITDSTILTWCQAGRFVCHCFLILPGGEVVPWSPDIQESGGVHDVGH